VSRQKDNEAILAGIRLLQEQYNQTGKISDYIFKLLNVSIERKRWYHLPNPKTHSTAYSPRCIRLSQLGPHWTKPKQMARLLLHEAKHTFQAKIYKPWKTRYVWSYIFDTDFFKRMEKEADDLTKETFGF
jgi:hypothetical protein